MEQSGRSAFPGPAVDLRGVTYSYGGPPAVEGLNLAIPSATSFGLVGPNGSGKSTLIKIIVGLLAPQRGTLQVLGRASPRATLELIGYMPQLPALYQELSVWENIDFFAQIFGLKGEEKRSYFVEHAVKLVDLWDRRSDPVLKLSGGMKQRVSLACAMVHQPRLLVLDEPTVGLDPELRATFWEHFMKLAGAGVTIVISSHTMDDAAHCDRLAFLREGRVVAEGTPGELVSASGVAKATLEDAFLFYVRQGRGSGGSE